MEDNIIIFKQLLKAYEARVEQLDNKDHIIVPVIMMVEGVHAGSRGPLLHKAEEFGKVPASYNGIPVTIHHPQVNGKYVSANSPQVLASWAVGKVFNTTLSKKKQLKAEAWLEVDKLNLLSAETLEAVQNGTTLEVSIGVYSDEEATSGVYNKENYIAVAKNHKPDHLALLPGDVGACSVKDGCGIRVNSQQSTKGGTNVDIVSAIQVLKDQGYAMPEIQDNRAQGLNQKLDTLRNLVRTLNLVQNGQTIEWNYLIEAYDDHVIYEVEGKGKYTYFKRNYQWNVKDDSPEFTSDPVEVKKTIEYKVITVNTEFVRTKFNNNSKKENEVMDQPYSPCVKEKANQLIQANKFCEDDREYLETLSEERLDKFLGTSKAPEAVPQVNTTVTKEQALNVLKSTLTQEEVIQLLPAESQESIRQGLTLHATQKTAMVQGILNNTAKDTWTEAELNAMNFDVLSKIHNSVKKADAPQNNSVEPLYTLFGVNNNPTPVNNNSNGIEPMGMTGIQFKG